MTKMAKIGTPFMAKTKPQALWEAHTYRPISESTGNPQGRPPRLLWVVCLAHIKRITGTRRPLATNQFYRQN